MSNCYNGYMENIKAQYYSISKKSIFINILYSLFKNGQNFLNKQYSFLISYSLSCILFCLFELELEL